jgi:hypothetical protein
MMNPSISPAYQQYDSPAPDQPTMEREPLARLFPEEADTLLESLVKARWQRLSSEYDDPLGMLFGNRAKQWTAGWIPSQTALYLLIWETDSWQEKPIWSLYQDGTLIFQEEDGFSQNRGGWLHTLLESEKLPFLSHQQFLEPTLDFLYPESLRQQANQALLSTILARPEIFVQLQEPLFKALERDLGNPEWPTLEVLKLHRLAHKIPLINLFRQFVEKGLIRTEKDSIRLDSILSRLQQEFSEQGPKISPLFQAMYTKYDQTLRQIVTNGLWRIKLKNIQPTEENLIQHS